MFGWKCHFPLACNLLGRNWTQTPHAKFKIQCEFPVSNVREIDGIPAATFGHLSNNGKAKGTGIGHVSIFISCVKRPRGQSEHACKRHLSRREQRPFLHTFRIDRGKNGSAWRKIWNFWASTSSTWRFAILDSWGGLEQFGNVWFVISHRVQKTISDCIIIFCLDRYCQAFIKYIGLVFDLYTQDVRWATEKNFFYW